MRKYIWLSLGALIGVIGPLIAGRLFSVVQDRVWLDMQLAQIRYIRQAAKEMPCSTDSIAYSSLVASIVEFNRLIAFNQAANQQWWTDWAVSDRWDNIQFIRLPCKQDQEIQ